jgi:transposase
VEFKAVDWHSLEQRLEGGRVVVAVDVAKEDFVASVFAADQSALVTFKWTHPEQSGEVLGRLRLLARNRTVEVALEPSGTYGDALVWQLRAASIAVYRVSPKRVHDAAEVYDGVPSLHDAKAASLIGRLHLQGVSQRWQEPSAERRELRAILTQLEVCKARQQAASNRLEAHLSRHWPESLQLLEPTSATLSGLIAAYGDAAAVRTDPCGAEVLMQRLGRPGLSQEKMQAVLASARHSIGVPCLPAERELLRWLATDLLEARKQMCELEQRIQRRVEHTPVLAHLGEVIGQVSAAVLVAALGSPRDYPDAGSYTKAMGLNLKERSSGKHKGQLKITKRGPPTARFYLYFAALRLIAHEPEVQRWFKIKTNRAGALKNKTVIELMRKLAKALWYVARGEQFDAAKLFNLKALASA